MAVLVTGGAGYIGSHTAIELLKAGERTIVVDSLVAGHRKAFPDGMFYRGDLRDRAFLENVFRENNIDSVMHFASFSQVGESVVNPLKYYNNNVISALSLIDKALEAGVRKFIFSSSASVYGNIESSPILESNPTQPANPYGETKLVVEKALQWAERAYGLKYIILRYFNAAGAHSSGEIGEDHRPETHLIPVILKAVLEKAGRVSIFGRDYPAPDGTCIRDYIHVTDLAWAHILGLKRLRGESQSGIYNLGNGTGFSNLEVVKKVEEVTGKKIEVVFSDRRAGDPPVLVASSVRAINDLRWQPRYSRLEDIIETAWRWHSQHPDGYADG